MIEFIACLPILYSERRQTVPLVHSHLRQFVSVAQCAVSDGWGRLCPVAASVSSLMSSAPLRNKMVMNDSVDTFIQHRYMDIVYSQCYWLAEIFNTINDQRLGRNCYNYRKYYNTGLNIKLLEWYCNTYCNWMVSVYWTKHHNY